MRWARNTPSSGRAAGRFGPARAEIKQTPGNEEDPAGDEVNAATGSTKGTNGGKQGRGRDGRPNSKTAQSLE